MGNVIVTMEKMKLTVIKFAPIQRMFGALITEDAQLDVMETMNAKMETMNKIVIYG